MLPPVTIMIPTYARVRWLEQALHSALAQQYDGEVRVLVFNDCPQQILQTRAPRVTVINHPTRFATLGEKRNAMVEHTLTEWVAALDDDDFLLPWHCQQRVAEGVRTGQQAVDAMSSWFYQAPSLSAVGGILVDLVLRRELMRGRYPKLDVGEDRDFRASLTAEIGPLYKIDNQDNPSYVYCWGNGAFHVSGGYDPFNGVRYLADANERLRTHQEPSGPIMLVPKPGFDVAWALAAMKLPYPHNFTTPTTRTTP